MKMWFPNKPQWIVIWVGFVLASICLSDEYERSWGVFAAVATIFVVWMLEGRRRKRQKDDSLK